MSKGIIVISYLANTRVYEALCVNKARPQLHCNGKCQMVKKIQEQESKEQKDPLKSFKFSESVYITTHRFSEVQQFLFFHSDSNDILQLSIGDTLDRARSFFHPPDFI